MVGICPCVIHVSTKNCDGGVYVVLEVDVEFMRESTWGYILVAFTASRLTANGIRLSLCPSSLAFD